ncbi:MAG: hypothetical protein WCO54_09765 [Bacteroidota bacterium]
MQLTTEYPFWLSLVCMLIAALASWLLYRNSKLDLAGKYRKVFLYGLMAFRFLSIFLMLFLLLGPLMKLISRKVEKPFIILAFDDSESIIATKDSASYRKEIPAIVEKIKSKLGSDYEIKTYAFGKNLKQTDELSFKQKQTNISSVFDEIDDAYSNQNLGAIVLATDGIYNEGSNPLYAAKKLNTPVFTIALGDTQFHKDLLIKNVKHNNIVYKGNMFPLQIDVKSFGCNNEQVSLTINHIRSGVEQKMAEQNVFTKTISISGNNFFTTIPVELEANEIGMQHYVISISKLNSEVTYVNNRTDVFVNVISGKQKILFLAATPHPDISAYKQAIESNENYQVELKYINEFSMQNIGDINLAILHQLPGWNSEGNIAIKLLKEKKIPLLYIFGGLTGVNILNVIENTLSVNTNRAALNDAQPILNNSFSLFTMSEQELNTIKKFPPLQSPYGNYVIRGESEILFKQQIGYVKTDYPLICFTKNADGKTGFICGEGFWKWRLYDEALSKQQTTQNLVGKIIQYLAAKDDKSLFRMVNSKKKFNENESVQFDAEVYNESYQLITTPEVQMVVKNAQGKSFNYTFTKTEKAYTLNAGLMPVGNYSYEATVNIGSKTEKLKGQFTVMPLQAEFLQTVADHQLLNQLAQQSEGKLFYLNQTDELIRTIKENEKIKPVIYKQEEVKSWINLKWIFFMLLALMSVEWFVRKWNGSV